jgi:hypothetical protein
VEDVRNGQVQQEGSSVFANIAAVVRSILGSEEPGLVTDSQENMRNNVNNSVSGDLDCSEPREDDPSDGSGSSSSSSSSSLEESESNGPLGPTGDSRLRFQDRVVENGPTKKVRDKTTRKDNVTSTHLKKRKMKAIFMYSCCENFYLRELGLQECGKQRKFYFGLSYAEKNIFLRGCVVENRSVSGYLINGNSFCRKGFKKLFSVGNNRLYKINSNIFSRVTNNPYCRETTSTHQNVVHWLNEFFSKNVNSQPDNDIHHLPDNWTKMEVYEAFKNETTLREEQEVTYSYFCRIWQKHYSRVRIPSRSRFSTCAPCTKFKAMRDKATLEEEKSKYITLVKLVQAECDQWITLSTLGQEICF